ncbi:MAG: PilZ domain-containing protein [Sphingomonadales bacterium]|nr:PilZ domain-containing protein [Sphingomonadales bacterium]
MAMEMRRESRLKVWMGCRLHAAGAETEGCLADLSPHGLHLVGQPPAAGELVEVRVRGRMLVGQVEWTSPQRFGVFLRDPLDPEALLRGDAPAEALPGPLPHGPLPLLGPRPGWAGAVGGLARSLERGALVVAALLAAVVLAAPLGAALRAFTR